MIEIESTNSGKVIVIGHRGAMAYAPENTMASFRLGLEQGADMVELDLQQSADGHLVAIHDGNVTRTTDGVGHISEMTLVEIKKLDAGVRFDERFRGEPVPTAEEVFGWAKGLIPLVVEIKGDPIPAAGIEKKLVALLRFQDLLDDVIVISAFHACVRRVKEIGPSLATGILMSGSPVNTVGVAREALCDSVRLPWNYWSKQLVDELHAAGLHTCTWQSDEDERTLYQAGLGIDSMGTNCPDRMRACLDRNGLSWDRR